MLSALAVLLAAQTLGSGAVNAGPLGVQSSTAGRAATTAAGVTGGAVGGVATAAAGAAHTAAAATAGLSAAAVGSPAAAASVSRSAATAASLTSSAATSAAAAAAHPATTTATGLTSSAVGAVSATSAGTARAPTAAIKDDTSDMLSSAAKAAGAITHPTTAEINYFTTTGGTAGLTARDEMNALAVFLDSEFVVPEGGTTEVRLIGKFADSTGRTCLTFRQTVVMGKQQTQASGIVCKRSGSIWRVVAPVFTGQASPQR